MKLSKPTYLALLMALLALVLSACAGGSTMAASGFGGATVAEDRAFFAMGQYVYAVNLANGTELWKYPEKGEAAITFFSSPALTEDGQVIAGSYNDSLYSLNPQTGGENWSYPAEGDFIASPLVTPNGIYAANADGNLYAVNFQGQKIWTTNLGGALWATPAANEDCDCLYLTSMNHHIYSVRASDGQMLWEKDLGSAMVGTPLVHEGVIYIGNFGNEMKALDAANGNEIWTTTVGGWVWSGPAFEDGKLFFGDLKGNFYALNASDGSIAWQVAPDGPITATPTLTDEAILVSTEAGSVFAYDRTGGTVWSQAVGGKLYASPVVSNATLLVTPIQTTELLVALNTNGTSKWVYPQP